VVDASVAVKWVVQEDGSDRAQLLSRVDLESPDLLWIECANILWKKVRVGDLDGREAAGRLELLHRPPVALVPSRELLGSALQLALDLKHPVYDCVYLALAVRRQIPLVTADRHLPTAVRKLKKPHAEAYLLTDLS